ncbi:unnamed protein product [Clonostachys rosea]|uniref:Uncharacterized protein n=1 Tax=Bionectria ochroleuca TaxID=29856 RepID=A0ABY6U6Z5_BIOOC|nr:unnamed protein product [Clonostachys rosea]
MSIKTWLITTKGAHEPSIHRIPWAKVASLLEWREADDCCRKKTNLHVRRESDIFAVCRCVGRPLAKLIKECADQERLRYPDDYPVSSPDDVVISDDVAKRILPTVRRLRQESKLWGDRAVVEEKQLCRHQEVDGIQNCLCSLPLSARRMKAFLHKHEWNDCQLGHDDMGMQVLSREPGHQDCGTFYPKNLESFLGLEIIKALVIHGELDTVLRICSHPGVDLEIWQDRWSCYCRGHDAGWELLYKNALQSYILLNVLFHLPDTWNWESSPSNSQQDYRSSSAYQLMVNSTTLSGQYTEIVQFPYRSFFGIQSGQFHYHPKLRNPKDWPQDTENKSPHRIPFGEMPYYEFLACENVVGYLPSAADISSVRRTFREKLGLPTEIVEIILSEAAYDEPLRQLPVAHHPFHKDNSAELKRYMEYCWELIVGCELMARAAGVSVSWGAACWHAVGDLRFCSCYGSHDDAREKDLEPAKRSTVPGRYRKYQEPIWPRL